MRNRVANRCHDWRGTFCPGAQSVHVGGHVKKRHLPIRIEQYAAYIGDDPFGVAPTVDVGVPQLLDLDRLEGFLSSETPRTWPEVEILDVHWVREQIQDIIASVLDQIQGGWSDMPGDLRPPIEVFESALDVAANGLGGATPAELIHNTIKYMLRQLWEIVELAGVFATFWAVAFLAQIISIVSELLATGSSATLSLLLGMLPYMAGAIGALAALAILGALLLILAIVCFAASKNEDGTTTSWDDGYDVQSGFAGPFVPPPWSSADWLGSERLRPFRIK